MKGDATSLLKELLPHASVSLLHIYFPSREYSDEFGRTRELFTPEFGETIYGLLKRGGALRLLTDQIDLFDIACGITSGTDRIAEIVLGADNAVETK